MLGFESTRPLRVSANLNAVVKNPSRFVSALDKFNESISGHNATESFHDFPNHCFANNAKSSKYQKPMPFKDKNVIKKLLDHLAKININHGSRKCIVQLVKLTNLAVCHFQCVSVWIKTVELLLSELFKGDAQLFTVSVMSNELIKVKMKEFSILALKKEKSKNHLTRQKTKRLDTSVIYSNNKNTYWLWKVSMTTLQYLSKYIPYHASVDFKVGLSEWVMKKAEQSLFKNEFYYDYFYVYWNRASFGIMKIKYTNNIEKRLCEWEIDCNHIVEKQYESPWLKNAKRIEKLIYIEFRHYRVFEPACHGCLKQHIEWFKNVHLLVIFQSIEFWSQWTAKKPYDSWGNLKRNGKKEIRQYFAELREASEHDEKEKSPTRTPPRTSPRNNLRRRGNSKMGILETQQRFSKVNKDIKWI